VTTSYVLGFGFTPDYNSVLLVEKTKGLHVGMLNGLGGVVKSGEPTARAMRREFQEESGFDVEESQWVEGAVLKSAPRRFGSPGNFPVFKEWEVFVYRTTLWEPYPLPKVDEAGPLRMTWLGDLHTKNLVLAPYVRSLVHLLRDQVEYGTGHTAVLRMREER
jgi:8-oxo-dGTP pyrophosphatase MutT (NUDIX family)